ncbi:cytochrome c oxidase subunit II [Halobacteriales archaeon QS_4_70_19]|nr:MAG: cytochrome c oxidase subunit II [Halobacteriales archaeon QS_4_70_19]
MARRRPPVRLGCLLVVGTALLALVPAAAAQSVNRAAIDGLNRQLLYVALPLTLFVELTLVYAIYRFHDNDDPEPTVDDPALETTWTAATAVILVFVGVSAYFVMGNPYVTPAAAGSADATAPDQADDLTVEVVAYQWGWQFTYPEANVTTRDELVVPVDRDVRLRMTSRDVIHSLFVPKLGVKQDVFPTQETVARTRATETGEYTLYCTELCGSGHSRMDGTVRVVNGSDYEEWLAARE